MTTGALALIILVAIVAQIAVALLIGFYRRGRQYRSLDDRADDHVGEIESVTVARPPTAAAEPVESVQSDIAWDGFREFIAQRRVMEDGHGSICSFYLVPADGRPLPAFRPGQFLTFKLAVDDQVTHQSKTVVRCYSLSDAPGSDYYRVSIKRVPSPADRPELPAGLSSNFFHDHVQLGSRLWVKMPSGHFYLMEDQPLPIVLIGGGIGITPMLSILNTLLRRGIKREVWLYYGVRNSDELIMKDHLQALATEHDNFHLHICYSAPHEGDVAGGDCQQRGRVDIPLLRASLKLMRYQFYICGPKPMMESLVPGLEEWGVDRGDIFYESFGPATLIRHDKPAQEATGAQPIITFSRSGKSIPWEPVFDSLLDFSEAKGIEVESGCRAGSCGSCQTGLKSGDVDYSQQPDAEVEPAHCLLCISTPKGDITLDA